MDIRRIGIFLALAFGISWTTALVVYLTGGLSDSPALIPGTNFTLALVLIAVPYMMAPALAHVLTRVLTGEGWSDPWLRLHFRRGWPYWALAWVLPALLTVAGAALFFVLFPAYFDPTLGVLRRLLESSLGEAADELPLSLPLLTALQALQAVLIAPIVNSLFTFGEEFGWRAYLQPKLMVLGWRKTMVWMGLIWGLWHAPVIVMGHNYGTDYPGAPWLGIVGMIWFSTVVGIFLGWLTVRAGSVWPAVIGHAALNGFASLPALFIQNEPNPLLGPLPVGIIGSLGFTAIAIWMFLREPSKSSIQMTTSFPETSPPAQ